MSKKNKAPSRGPHKRRFFCGSLCVIGLVGLLIGLSLWLVQTLPTTAITQIGRLTNTQLEVQSCVIDLDGSVNIQGLRVYPHDKVSESTLVLRAETVYARFDRWSVFKLKPRLSHIDIRDFLFDAKYNVDAGHWNIGSLRINAPSGKGGKMPQVNLENGLLQYSTVVKERPEIVTAIPVNAQFNLHEETDEGYQFEIKTAQIYPGLGQSLLTGSWRPGLVVLRGGISSTDRPSLERSLSINAMAAQLAYEPNKTYDLDLSIRNLYGPPVQENKALDLVFRSAANPLAGLQQFFYRYRPSGKADIRLKAQGNLADLANSQINGRVDCLDLAVCDRKFAYPMEHLTGPIFFTNHTIDSNGLSAQHGEVPIDIAFSLQGGGSDSKYKLHVKSDKMRLDNDLYAALNAQARRAWDLVAPQGYAAIDYRRERRSPSDTQRTLSVILQNTSATYKGFPYPLNNLTGRIDLGEDHITLTDVVSHTDTLSVQLNGQIRNYRDPHPQHDLLVQADSLPLDNTLGQALSPQQRAAYKALQIQGTTHADVYIRTDPNDTRPASIYTYLSFQNASLLAPGIPLPFDHLHGQAVLSAQSITLQDLRGEYSGNPVCISGNITLNEQSQAKAFDLAISSEGMQISDFVTALPDRVKRAITKLQAQGKVAFSAQISQTDPSETIQYEAILECLSDRLRMQKFPYPFKDVTGKLVIDNQQCLIQGLRAIPDTNTASTEDIGAVQLNGQIAFAKGEMRGGNFHISADGLPIDATLAQALPEHLRAPFAQLAPSGQLSLSPTDVIVAVTADGIQHVDYLTILQLPSVTLKVGGTPVKMRGSIEATGHFDSRDGMIRGLTSLALDSLSISHKEITDLKALLTYDPKTRLWQSNDLTGNLYDGTMLGQFGLQQNPTGALQCKAQVGIHNMNLQDFLEASPGKNGTPKKQTTGTANGTISFAASQDAGASRMGRCTFQVENMQVGKLSPLAQALTSLGLNKPRDYAFEKLVLDSYIQGDKLLIETLDMSGKSVAFQGSGALHLTTGELDLALIARGSRISLKEPSVFQSLTEGLVGAVVQLEFSGHYSNPQFTTKALPLIENSFRRLARPEDK